MFPHVKEVVLVEDASPDNSLEVCRSLLGTDPRITLIQHPDGGNHGAGASRDLGYVSSVSPFVVFLDADDVFLPNRFDKEREVFAEHPDADGVYGATGTIFHDEIGRQRFMEVCPQDELTTVAIEVPPERLFSGMLGCIKGFGYFHLDAFTIRRSAIERLHLRFPSREEVWHEDTEFCLKLAHGSRLYAGELREPIALRGVHAHNRYTAIEDMAATRHVLYQRLEAWSHTVAMGRDERRMLVASRIYYGMFGHRSFLLRVAYLRHFLRHPWLFHWVQVREAFIHSLFNRSTWMAKVLRTLSWKIFRNEFTTIY